MKQAEKMKKIPTKSSGQSCKPKIDYPCTWQYKIIGESATAITRLVKEHVHEKRYTLTDSNVSSGGRHISMALELIVNSDERRLELYKLLAADSSVKVVL